ncbi:FAD/NAD(P)-binding domain-containing protein [Pseudonocardia eucalypti]|uniref:FAD/NAD(P)-binding domain-containing protein n=1 Tax=Pseudonocardia eucalypti TaxID=648755 RepID=A0ABP9RF76_9PSEU|nr:putative NAD(P)/FAD-binding protein YdhS [Pseudonocardia eucalypti]
MDLATIGGGSAAVSLLDALAASPGKTGTVTVFEPSPHLWRGRPYGPDLEAVLVNAPPGIMSIRSRDFGHYAAWLGERAADHLDPLMGEPLVPRALYGEYLVDTAEKALAALAEQGWLVRVAAARVTEVARSGAHLALRTDDAHEHHAGHVALCVGGGTPPDVYGLGGTPGFIADPYPLSDTLNRVPADGHVAVIGSGLTAVDIVAALAARGHSGRITLLSRSGVLPHVWQRPNGRQPRHVTAENVSGMHKARGNVTLDDLAGLLRRELADAGEDFDELLTDLRATATDDPVQRFRRQFAAVDDPRIGRRVVQQTAHSVGPFAWPLLPAADRAWLRHHSRTVTSVASPMIPRNAAVLIRLLDSGQLTLASGVDTIEPVNRGFRVHDNRGEHRAEIVFNAVNPPPRTIPAAAQDLARSLVDAGLATAHPAGGLVPADPRVHVVGDLGGGRSFITSSIPGVAAQAALTAKALTTASGDF